MQPVRGAGRQGGRGREKESPDCLEARQDKGGEEEDQKAGKA